LTSQTQPTLLIADDEPSMRLLVRATIESDAYRVIEAGDGDEAWMLIQRYRPSLVLLDIQMPGRTGLEILRSIKTDPGLKATHVILLSAKALRADVDMGMAAGADHYLTKPFSPLELLTRVEEALRPAKPQTSNRTPQSLDVPRIAQSA
jgi:two-component system phosphate regulon response regulator PhoB